ncbi:MAG: hypothetical protein IPP14_05385 [Planctomycetes bacterium]|nr:hypothetical protein [Planctomycetota bacterium]
MIARATAIACATLLQQARSSLARLVAALLVACVPVGAWLMGQDAASRAWAARTLAAEGLRFVLPLAAVIGGAFALRPSMKQGWALLPARRMEWFFGAALAGAILALGSVALFAGGAWLAGASIGDAALLVIPRRAALAVGGSQSPNEAAQTARRWAAVRGKETRLTFEFESPQTTSLRGEIDYELIWTQEAPPARGVPFDVLVFAGDASQALASQAGSKCEVRALSRRRAAFEIAATPPGRCTVLIVPNDPTLAVGVREHDVVIEAGQTSQVASLALLALVALAAALLCMAVTLGFRALTTAPTAALAGLLLLASLTLLPGITSAGQMAADRRASVESEGGQSDPWAELENSLANLPPLLPAGDFETYLHGRTVDADVAASALWRALAALALLPLGALLFGRRQIAR